VTTWATVGQARRLRDEPSRSKLASAAEAVANAAQTWQSAAYTAYFRPKEEHGENSGEAVLAEIEAEKAAVLAAYGGTSLTPTGKLPTNV
jgi:hypothetical protein